MSWTDEQLFVLKDLSRLARVLTLEDLRMRAHGVRGSCRRSRQQELVERTLEVLMEGQLGVGGWDLGHSGESEQA